MVTNQEIREYLNKDVDPHDLCKIKHRDMRLIMEELLSLRSNKKPFRYMREGDEWIPVSPEDPRYEDAPYESSLLFDRIPTEELKKHKL
jgi:hypothetical protein